MIQHEIEGGSLPVVICHLAPGQTVCAERGSMCWMSPNVNMQTSTGGGLKKAIGRLFSGDSLFLNEYTPQGGNGMLALASSFPGKIVPFEIRPGYGIIIQKSGFLAMEKGLDLSVHFQKKFGSGFFGGEGFILQKITGSGTAFVEIDGYCKEYELAAGQSIVVDTGCLAAMSESCSMDIRPVQGAKNIFFGGEGLFNTVITGPGKVYLQSMPIANLVRALEPYLPTPDDSSGSTISFNLGDK